jgi:hypothetical protein
VSGKNLDDKKLWIFKNSDNFNPNTTEGVRNLSHFYELDLIPFGYTGTFGDFLEEMKKSQSTGIPFTYQSKFNSTHTHWFKGDFELYGDVKHNGQIVKPNS